MSAPNNIYKPKEAVLGSDNQHYVKIKLYILSTIQLIYYFYSIRYNIVKEWYYTDIMING